MAFPRIVPNPSPFGCAASPTIPLTTWDEGDVRRAIVPERLAELARHLGVELTGKVRGKWIECRAVGRDDETASATINRETGAYTDKGGDGKSISLFDLAIKTGTYRNFPEAVNGLGAFFGVTPKSGFGGPEPKRDSSKSSKSCDSSKSSKSSDFKKRVWKTLDLAVAGSKPPDSTEAGRWEYPGGGFVCVRFNEAKGGKTVRPYHSDPLTGLWSCGDPPGPLPLYRGDRIGSGLVLVTEGEKCADLAASLGFAAVTSSHGANSASKSDWSALNGREVVILPDANEAGASYRDAVVGILRGLDPARRVRVLDLPGLTPGSGDDIAEWLEAQPDLWTADQVQAEFKRLVDGAPEAARAVDPDEWTDEELGLVTLADVADQELSWLWPDRILNGALTVLGGYGEVGKSFATLDIIARLTTGRPFPDQIEATEPPCDAIFVTAEDRIGMVVKKRSQEMGADLKRVHSIGMGRDKKGNPLPFTIEDIPRLERIVKRRSETRLIVIDPVASFLGRADENKNAELRRVLGPLNDFADRTNIAIICIVHFGKSQAARVAQRIIGSVAWLNFARSAWAVMLHPDNENLRCFVRLKNNLSDLRTGLTYTIEKQPSGQGKVVWDLEPCTLDADEIAARAGGQGKRAEKRTVKNSEFLDAIKAVLANGPIKSDDVWGKLPEGMSRAGYFRIPEAERKAVVKSVKGSDGSWFMKLNLDNQ